MSISRTAIAAVFLASALIAPMSANAFSIDPSVSLPDEIEHVSGGCGPNGWRGPWGHCRYNGGWGSHWGCPPGWWRGPWGHCRHTIYHGRLPGGGWK